MAVINVKVTLVGGKVWYLGEKPTCKMVDILELLYISLIPNDYFSDIVTNGYQRIYLPTIHLESPQNNKKKSAASTNC